MPPETDNQWQNRISWTKPWYWSLRIWMRIFLWGLLAGKTVLQAQNDPRGWANVLLALSAAGGSVVMLIVVRSRVARRLKSDEADHSGWLQSINQVTDAGLWDLVAVVWLSFQQ